MADKLRKVGRALTLLGMLGVGMVLSLLSDTVSGWVNGAPPVRVVFDTIGALAAFAIFIAWGLAIYHWGRQPFGDPGTRRRWGLAVTLGAFVGAWAYWLAGPQEKRSA